MQRVRLRVFAFVIGLTLATVGVVSWAALPLWPVVGVAVAAAAVAVNTMTARLKHPTCWSCGSDVSGLPAGQYGVICQQCGSINQRLPLDDASDGESGPTIQA